MKKIFICDDSFHIVGADPKHYRTLKGNTLFSSRVRKQIKDTSKTSVDITPILLYNRPHALVTFDEAPFDLLKTIIDSTLEGILLSHNHTILYVNRPLQELTGFRSEEVIGKNLLGWVHPDFQQEVIEKIGSGDSTPYEIKIRHKEGHYFWVLVKGHTLALGQKRYRITGFVDIDEQKRAFEKYKQKAARDPLTGLYNRSSLIQLLHNRPHATYALFFLDLDDFKEINDTYGHRIGDRCLQFFASLLSRAFRKEDIIARIGGDEFIVVAHIPAKDHHHHGVEAIAQKLQRLIRSNPCKIDNLTIPLQVSIGVALFDDTTHIDTILQKADEAMYRIKRRGKDDYFILR